jgi:hypothetical protein
MLRSILLAIVMTTAVFASDTIEAFGLKWRVPTASDWKVETIDGIPTLSLLVPKPSTQPRRPSQFAIAETPDYMKVTVEAEMKQEPAAVRNRHNSVMIAYAWKDENHFNYAHMSVDSPEKVEHHNGVFTVNGGDRVRVSPQEGPASLTNENWHKVKLVYDGTSGKVQVWVDGVTSPSLTAIEKSYGAGKVGIGSFFDMGQFRNVKITGSN